MSDSEKELIERARARRGNPARLEKPASDVSVRRPSSHVVSIRLSSDDFIDLMEAIEASGESLSEYMRQAINLRRTVDQLTGGWTFEVMSRELEEANLLVRHKWSGNSLPHKYHGISDYPPKGVAAV